MPELAVEGGTMCFHRLRNLLPLLHLSLVVDARHINVAARQTPDSVEHAVVHRLRHAVTQLSVAACSQNEVAAKIAVQEKRSIGQHLK